MGLSASRTEKLIVGELVPRAFKPRGNNAAGKPHSRYIEFHGQRASLDVHIEHAGIPRKQGSVRNRPNHRSLSDKQLTSYHQRTTPPQQLRSSIGHPDTAPQGHKHQRRRLPESLQWPCREIRVCEYIGTPQQALTAREGSCQLRRTRCSRSYHGQIEGRRQLRTDRSVPSLGCLRGSPPSGIRPRERQCEWWRCWCWRWTLCDCLGHNEWAILPIIFPEIQQSAEWPGEEDIPM